jgi:eukaryotic-like serine/threonine-protein kinase
MRRLGEHPHVVTVFDTGEEDGRPYVASRYMPGGDVKTVLDGAEDRRLPIERALGIAADVCRALEHAHSRGIIHRDLKPANVWLAEDGSARLGDFGLAATDQRSRAAVEGMLVGTVAYLPPEQALGRVSDARADLYSLGAMLYEMLTGQPPFPGDDAVAIISQHLNAAPVPPSRDAPEVSPGLDELVLRLLAKNPRERPKSARVVRRELEQVATAPSGTDAERVDGEDNPLDRLAGGVFVGREAELSELRDALEGTIGGRGGVLLLVGEPGIGKTRTAEELATYARVRGAKVHWGRSHEGDGAPAYWPWAQAIRSYVREADPVALAWELGQGAGDVAQLVPDVRDRLGEVEEPPALDPEEARFRLFDSVATFLAGASRSRPLVLVLDDLHWADEPSLLLLKFVARQASDSGLLVVGTYRDVELGRHHPLARTLAELAEIQGSRRIPLRGLDTEAVERFIERTAGIEPAPGLAEAVHEQTEGNPFFITEIVRLMASEGSLENPVSGGWALAVPQGVREVVGRRLDSLPKKTNHVLTIAAAVGREFELDVLERVDGMPRVELAAAIEQAIESQVVYEAERAPGRYAFSHALVRETLYAELTGTRRIEIHRRIGEALEEVHAADPDPPVAELAHHFITAAPAGEAAKAISYAERAAQRAADQLAHEDAAAHYERALEVLDFSPGSDPARRLGLLLELGEAQRPAGRFVPARETFAAAAGIARELGETESLVRAALGMSALSEVGRVDETIVALIEESLAAIGGEDSLNRVELLGGLSQELVWRDPQGEAAPLTRESVAIARRIGEPRVLAAALAREMFLMVASPEAARRRLTNAEEMLELAEGAGDRELAVRAHVYRLIAFLDIGDVARADLELDTYSRLAAELRMPQHLWHVPLLRGMRASMDGRFADAERLAQEARRGGERAQEPLSAQLYALQMSVMRRHQGRVEEILPSVREMAERYPAIRAWRLALVSLLADAGRLEEAGVEFERLAGHDFDDIPLDAQWLTAITRIADACAHIGDAARAATLYEMLHPFADLAVVAGRAASISGPVSMYLGRLALTMGRADDAVGHLDQALEMATRMGDRPYAAETAHHLAAALLERGAAGDRVRALELLARCLEAAQEMGMRLLIERSLALRLEAQGLAAVDVTTSIDTVISAVENERPDIRSFASPDGTVTVLFSDIEDSTLMTERLGDERWLEVLRAHNAAFRRHLRAHGGYEVKNQGDGFMLVFPDPCRAVECAIAIQEALAEQELAEGERIRVRMGLHVGAAIREEGDFFGRSVILAARIAAQARGGEILVSSSLRQKAEEEGTDLSFDAGRDLELKGLTGTHRVYRASWEKQATAA